MPGPTMESELPVEPQSLKKLSFKSLKRALDLFSPLHSQLPPPDLESKKIRMSHKLHVEYGGIKTVPNQPAKNASQNQVEPSNSNALVLPGTESSKKNGTQSDLALTPVQPKNTGDGNLTGKSTAVIPVHGTSDRLCNVTVATIQQTVISGHLGWVRSIAFDPSNQWFCTGSADRTIKIWDVGSGRLRLTLTGHIEQVRGLAVSTRHTYMFSAGDDKQVIRSYHGHLSGVYCLALHPTIDVLLTGGRDSVCRVWDIRSKMQIHALSGHDNTVCSVFTRPTVEQWQLLPIIRNQCVHWPSILPSDNGSLWFWDWKSGHSFQQSQTIVQPGTCSLDSEAGIYALSYDITGSRLITCEADKTIKMWKEDENATPETHPVNFKPPKDIRRF
ncbi:G-protein beta WD-40 repeat-containing protein [Cynara cardunculus var. scolymus]|uniref:G-protein beta WD-40 repeat-containing protein n=1 Tax=Cynara cardunculus var. scolymus TaxID=59895 RepID=A0A103XUP8_CYNCS|nr:G-protein beta WD-40 repeat-containing protein [Cynara cardunculus var. scolymus]